jgi:MFS family permease
MAEGYSKDLQYYRFCLYGFLKNLRFFEAFLILFLLEKEQSFLAIGSLYAIREITVNIFEVPSGMIADAFGRRRTMIMAFAFYILSFILFYLSRVYAGFALAMIVFSLGEAFRSGNHKAMIYHYLQHMGWDNQKVHYYGNTRSWSQMGSALSALSGAAIVFISGGYRYIFLFSVIPYVLDMINVASYPRFLEGPVKKTDWNKIRSRFISLLRDLYASISSKKVIRILGSLSMYSGYYKAIKDYLQPVIAAWAVTIPLFISYREEQRTSVLVGVVFFVVYMLSSLTSRYSGKFSERFSSLSAPMNFTLLLGFSMGILSGFFYVLELWLLSVLLFIVVYMVENLRKPVGVAFLGENVRPAVTATVLSVDSQIKSFTAALLAPLFGIFADLFGVGWSLFVVSALLLVISPLLMQRKK